MKHHQNLQKEFATAVEKVCQQKGLESHPALPQQKKGRNKRRQSSSSAATNHEGGDSGDGTPKLPKTDKAKLKARSAKSMAPSHAAKRICTVNLALEKADKAACTLSGGAGK